VALVPFEGLEAGADGCVLCDAGAVGEALALPPPPATTVRVGRTADGPTPPAEELGVGVGGGVDPPDGPPGGVEPDDPPDEGGLEGAPEGLADPPCSVTTAPPGEKVIVLVHCPAGAALVAVAVMACDCPPPSVPEF
jgi:hypothetical protein